MWYPVNFNTSFIRVCDTAVLLEDLKQLKLDPDHYTEQNKSSETVIVLLLCFNCTDLFVIKKLFEINKFELQDIETSVKGLEIEELS